MFDSDKLVQQVEALVLKRVAEDQLLLPTMPAVAERCRELLKKPDVPLKEVAGVLEQDPLLAARVLRVATSAAYAQAGGRLTLLEALTRLGTKQVGGILLEAAAAKLFLSRDPSILKGAQAVWQHSVAVGVLSRDLCALLGGSDSELAHLAGLFHDIGKPLVASILLAAEQTIVELHRRKWIESREWLEVIARTHRKVGVALIDKWQLPPEIGKTIGESSEFDPSDRIAVRNIVCFANAIAKQAGVCPPGTDLEEAGALVMVGRSLLGLDDTLVNTLTGSLKSKIDELY